MTTKRDALAKAAQDSALSISASDDDTQSSVAPWEAGSLAIWSSTDDADAVMEALSDAESLRAQVGRTLHVQNIVGHMVEIADPDTGELVPQPRSIILAKEGTFQCVSNGVLQSLRIVCALYGRPPWPNDKHPSGPLALEVKEIETTRHFRVLRLVRPKKAVK